jgi:hypothetical protein
MSVHGLRTIMRGALRPPDNDSDFLLDVHRRAVPRERMARYDDDFSVDLAIVGAGAGGATLAQRLARRGWGWWCSTSSRSGTPTRIGSPTKPAHTGCTGPTSG